MPLVTDLARPWSVASTLEQRVYYCNVNNLTGGCTSCAPVSLEWIEICSCDFHQSVGKHKHISFSVSSITILEATPTKNQNGSRHTEVYGMS